ASKDESFWARIDGHVSAVTNPTELDKIWNAIAGAWFEDGKQDPDVQLIRFDLTEAEVWATDGGFKFLYEIGKAQLTGEKPDMGKHGTIRF
ncbi:MAG: pyridoxamine 5'-phosphate oxidase family protein, partial [Sulfitobacter sp.]